MEWFENDELGLVAGTIDDFAAKEVVGKVFDLETLAKPPFPRAALERLAVLGFLWGPAPEDVGSGMDDIAAVTVLSRLAGASAGFASVVAAHYAALRSVLALPDGEAVLRRAAGSRGEGLPLIGLALESHVRSRGGTGAPGGDRTAPSGPRNAARYVVVPAPAEADMVVLFTGAGADESMVLETGAGVSRFEESAIPLSGCDEMPVSRLSIPAGAFDGEKVVATGADAAVGRGAMVSSLKLYYSAVMHGAARAAAADALGYAQQRRQTGRAIIFHQNVYKKLVEMETKNQSVASFLYRAAFGGAAGTGFSLNDMLYAFTKTESEHVVSEAMQTLGGYGYTREYGIEKKLRDVKTLQALLPTALDDWLGFQQAGGC